MMVFADGAISIDGEELRQPGGGYKAVTRALFESAGAMPQVPLIFDGSGVPVERGPTIPGNPIVIRADRRAPFGVVKSVLEICGHETIKIWDIRVVALDAETGELGMLRFELTRDVGISCPAPDLSEVVFLELNGEEFRSWRSANPHSDPPLDPVEFRAESPADMQAYLHSLKQGEYGDVWRLDAPSDAKWSDAVVILDTFIAAGRKWIVPSDWWGL